MKPTEEQIEALEAEHGKVWLVPFGVDDGEAPTVENAEHVWVIRRPKRVAFERFEKDCLDEKRQMVGLKNLAIDCVVWPPKGPEREAVLDEFPGALGICGGEGATLGRGDAVERAKLHKASTKTPAATR